MAQAAADKISGVLGSFGASFMAGGAQEPPKEDERKINFSDDEDDWAKMRQEVIKNKIQ